MEGDNGRRLKQRTLHPSIEEGKTSRGPDSFFRYSRTGRYAAAMHICFRSDPEYPVDDDTQIAGRIGSQDREGWWYQTHTRFNWPRC